MTTIRSDVLVLGSTLGGLVAATYLARAGLRVVLLEEDTHAKRMPLMREPFFLSGLEPGGCVMQLFRELALPLIEQRQIRRESTGLQIALHSSRIDLPRGRATLARELAAHALGEAKLLREFFESVDAQGARAQAELPDEIAAGRRRATSARLAGERGGSRVLLPAAPPGLSRFIRAQLTALSSLEPPESSPAPAMLLRATREGGFSMPHGESSFLDLFRRRFLTLHGEIRSLAGFSLLVDRNDIGIELARDRLFGRALVLAVPREPLRGFMKEFDDVPIWLEASVPPLLTPRRLFRAPRRVLPTGMAARLIRADEISPQAIHWWTRVADPHDQDYEWLLASGPGAERLDPRDPLGSLAPFSAPDVLPVDPGPLPRWDRDGVDFRFLRPQIPAWLRTRPMVATVGPELAPGLGLEGELLCARQVALRLVAQLGARKRLS